MAPILSSVKRNRFVDDTQLFNKTDIQKSIRCKNKLLENRRIKFRVLDICLRVSSDLVIKMSGGIVIVFKELESLISFCNTESEFVQWLILSAKIFNLDTGLLPGCIHIPPEGSNYTSTEAINEIEADMFQLSQNNRVAVVGDFNAKTEKHPDFVEPDNSLINVLNIKNKKRTLQLLV